MTSVGSGNSAISDEQRQYEQWVRENIGGTERQVQARGRCAHTCEGKPCFRTSRGRREQRCRDLRWTFTTAGWPSIWRLG